MVRGAGRDGSGGGLPVLLTQTTASVASVPDVSPVIKQHPPTTEISLEIIRVGARPMPPSGACR